MDNNITETRKREVEEVEYLRLLGYSIDSTFENAVIMEQHGISISRSTYYNFRSDFPAEYEDVKERAFLRVEREKNERKALTEGSRLEIGRKAAEYLLSSLEVAHDIVHSEQRRITANARIKAMEFLHQVYKSTLVENNAQEGNKEPLQLPQGNKDLASLLPPPRTVQKVTIETPEGGIEISRLPDAEIVDVHK